MSIISKAQVLSIKGYGPDIREYTLKLDESHYFEAGTFLLLTLEHQESYSPWPVESRNFSMASAYSPEGTVKLVIRKVGFYTKRIFEELKVGSTCMVKYAFGDFLLPFFDKESPICCIAGGTGIAPILSFCEQLKRDGQAGRLHVFYSFKSREELIGGDVLTATVPASQLHLYCTRESCSEIKNCRISTSDIVGYTDNWTHSHFYICGNESFVKTFRQFLEKAGCENIYSDEW